MPVTPDHAHYHREKIGIGNMTWGSDYPHMEGTFGHTQETLHEL